MSSLIEQAAERLAQIREAGILVPDVGPPSAPAPLPLAGGGGAGAGGAGGHTALAPLPPWVLQQPLPPSPRRRFRAFSEQLLPPSR